MRKLPLITAVAGLMWALPASAGYNVNAAPSTPELSLAQLDVCVGPDCRREREHRYYGREERCREVTIRERRGGEVVVRHERRCD